MSPEDRAKEIAMHTDADCGDCGCPKELGGPGYCQALYYKTLRSIKEAVAEAACG